MNKSDITNKIKKKKSEINKVKIDGVKIVNQHFLEKKYSNIIADSNYISNNVGGFFMRKKFYHFRKYVEEHKNNFLYGFKSGSMVCYIWGELSVRWTEFIFYKYSPGPGKTPHQIYKTSISAYDTWDINRAYDELKSIQNEYQHIKFDNDEITFFNDLADKLQDEIKSKIEELENELNILKGELLEEKRKSSLREEEKRKQEIEERNRQELERKKRIQENYHNFRKISQDSIDKVKEMRNEIVFKYDVDGNEMVDDVEENVFVGIIRNNNEVLEKKIGADKVHKLVKLSIYLNKKRDNIQNLYGCFLGVYNDFYKKEQKQEICIAKVIEESEVMFTTNISKFYFSREEENIVKDIDKALYNELNTYKTMLFHSTSMVVSAKKGDLITFFEIYEVFDKLGVFDSNWENEVSSKLSDVSNKLSDVSNKLSEISNKLTDVSIRLSNIHTGIGMLIQSVNRMNDEIVGELISLNYIVDSSISSLEASVNYELQGIKSSVDFNNLLTSVNTYQLSKLNSKTNKLLKG